MSKKVNKYLIFLSLIVLVINLISCGKDIHDKNVEQIIKGKQKVNVLIKTAKGDMVAELRPDLMPITVKNFLKLVDMKFYDNLKFHRVEDWVIQGGDPVGNGTGGPGWEIKLETNPSLKNIKYCIAMARSSNPDSAGSQFYILKKDTPSLDGQYAVFGNIIKGQDIVDKIKIGDKIISISITE